MKDEIPFCPGKNWKAGTSLFYRTVLRRIGERTGDEGSNITTSSSKNSTISSSSTTGRRAEKVAFRLAVNPERFCFGIIPNTSNRNNMFYNFVYSELKHHNYLKLKISMC